MLVEVRYTPGIRRGWSIFAKIKNQGWKEVESFMSESMACREAKEMSMAPDLPYTIRYEYGQRLNDN